MAHGGEQGVPLTVRGIRTEQGRSGLPVRPGVVELLTLEISPQHVADLNEFVSLGCNSLESILTVNNQIRLARL